MVRLVAPDGAQIGVKKLAEAMWLAEQLDLDLVEVAPMADPPVCRLMDYGRFKYERSVKERAARKSQSRTVIKELRLRPRIEDHDFDMQTRKVVSFLSGGDKVKLTVRFRGRERERPEYGQKLLSRLADAVSNEGVMEQAPKMEGRNMTMMLAPISHGAGGRRQRQRKQQRR